MNEGEKIPDRELAERVVFWLNDEDGTDTGRSLDYFSFLRGILWGRKRRE